RPDCNVIFLFARAKLKRPTPAPPSWTRPMDHGGPYHWHNAMSLTFPTIFALLFEIPTDRLCKIAINLRIDARPWPRFLRPRQAERRRAILHLTTNPCANGSRSSMKMVLK